MTSRFAAAVGAAVDGRPCVVALGGGADSALLLDASVQAVGVDNVRAVFVFHGLESSLLLKESATKAAEHTGVALTVLEGLIDGGAGIEDRARAIRYETIEANLASDEIALTGHTMTDQAETVLMRLARGSGAGGLAGIPFERGSWRRPFLDFEREVINAEATRRNLPFVEDPANRDERHFRSFVRHHIIPDLERDHAPGLTFNIARSASLLREDDVLLDSLADMIPVIETGDRVMIAVPPLLTADRPVATRAIRSALRKLGDQYPGSMNDVDRVMNVAMTGRTGFVSGHVEVRLESPLLILEHPIVHQGHESKAIDAPGAFTWSGDRYRVFTSTYPTAMRTAGRFSVLYLDDPAESLEVRGICDGDTLDIGTGSARVVELLREQGVPASARSRSLLVVSGGKVAAVHGVRTASWAQPRTGEEVTIVEREVDSWT
ncbi:MAG: tRNA lysidine(34) synthetase TilS [Actinomycetia bacterium]|nr:tRNA lysidine(34) synthetase TilS [Actinomycetes bacterium]